MDKKVIPLICEGYSDLVALEDYLNDLFRDKAIQFFVASGDITSDRNKKDKYLNELIEDAIFNNPNRSVDFTIDDILMVAHLVDTDGVFESDDVVKYDGSLSFNQYFDDHILACKSVKEMNETRALKRDRLLDCIDTDTIAIKNRNLIYRIFYMSVNLEHVTQDNQNVETEIEKMDFAEEFATRFDKLDDFVSFLEHNNTSGTHDYKESWKYIRKHSLNKATNLIVFVEYLLEKFKD